MSAPCSSSLFTASQSSSLEPYFPICRSKDLNNSEYISPPFCFFERVFLFFFIFNFLVFRFPPRYSLYSSFNAGGKPCSSISSSKLFLSFCLCTVLRTTGLIMFLFRSAIWFFNGSILSSSQFSSANMRAVLSSLSLSYISAPFSNSIGTISIKPFSIATMSAVLP